MPTPWRYEGQIRIRKFCVGGLENNVYVIADTATGEAVIIDAADEADRIVTETSDVRPTAILTTHGHWDHVRAAGAVRDRLGVPLRIHSADAPLAGIEPDAGFDDDIIRIGSTTVTALHTPGHTPGSTCFLVGGHLFSGDTLFPGGPGATADPEAFDQIMASLETHLFSLPDETIVHPGHGLDTTIGTERPAIPQWRDRRY